MRGSILQKHCPLKLFVTITVPKFPYVFIDHQNGSSPIQKYTPDFQTIPHALTFNKRSESVLMNEKEEKNKRQTELTGQKARADRVERLIY